MSSDVLPEQFFSRPSLATLCPEAALMCAVLEDALDCVQKQFISETRRAKHLGQETEQWLFSDDSNWAFSFVAICNALDLSPEYIRLKLKRCNEPRQDASQNKRRAYRDGTAATSSLKGKLKYPGSNNEFRLPRNGYPN